MPQYFVLGDKEISFFYRNDMLGTLDFTCLKYWASKNFLGAQP